MQLLTSLVAVNSVNATPRLYLYSYIVSFVLKGTFVGFIHFLQIPYSHCCKFPLLVKELETVEPHYETLYLLIVALSKTLVDRMRLELQFNLARIMC